MEQSTNAYEPGTVAVATVGGVPNVRVMWRDAGDGWFAGWFAESGHAYAPASKVTDIRPLVVLDLDGHADVTALLDDIREAVDEYDTRLGPGTALDLFNAIADQIGAQTKPPKHVEPKGLGAVVEDSEHRLWIRHTNDPGTFPWICYGVSTRGWSEIDAVKVLSEGVQSWDGGAA